MHLDTRFLNTTRGQIVAELSVDGRAVIGPDQPREPLRRPRPREVGGKRGRERLGRRAWPELDLDRLALDDLDRLLIDAARAPSPDRSRRR
jgi:hypothetical protein